MMEEVVETEKFDLSPATNPQGFYHGRAAADPRPQPPIVFTPPSELPGLQDIPAGWEDPSQIEAHVVEDQDTLIAVCRLMLTRARITLSSLSDNDSYSKGGFPTKVGRAFDYVKKAITAIRYHNSLPADIPRLALSINEKTGASAVAGPQNIPQVTVLDLRLKEVDYLEIELTLTQAESEDPRVARVPFKFGRAILCLLPQRHYEPIRAHLVTLTRHIYPTILEPFINDVLMFPVSRDEATNFNSSALLNEFVLCARYSSYKDPSARRWDSFQQFKQMKKLEAVVMMAREAVKGNKEEYQTAGAIIQGYLLPEHIWSLSSYAKQIVKILVKSTQGFKSDTFLFALMVRLAPFINYDLSNIINKRFLQDSARVDFRSAFAHHYLKTSLDVSHISQNSYK
jgi:hypothetical protein